MKASSVISGDVTAVVPFRCPWHGKSRLRRQLPSILCDAVSYAMFRDVVATVRSSGVARTVALVHGVCGLPAAVEAGADPLIQPASCEDLTTALTWAVERLSTERLLIVAADLPCLRTSDVLRVLSRPEDVVVASTQDGGTALMGLRPPARLRTSFGGASAARHVLASRSAGQSATLVDRRETCRDVDVFADLRDALTTGAGKATASVVRHAVTRARLVDAG